jgi:Cu-processing system permease protein
VKPDDRYEKYEYSWGTFMGFIFFLPRMLFLPALIHIVLLAVGGTVVYLLYAAGSDAHKWAIFAFVLLEIILLSFFGFKAHRISWKSCKWKDPHKFVSSNSAYGFFGRFFLLARVLNVAAYCFLQKPGVYTSFPPWLLILGFVLLAALIAFIVWRVRGPIWAVALNTLKESISKLEVVTLFLIGAVFVIMFNSFWHVPAVQTAVMAFFEETRPAVEESAGSEEYTGRLEIETSPQSTRFTGQDIQKGNLRLRVQVAAFLFGEFFIALICFALGIFLLTGEIQRGAVLTVLPKPIGRGEYVLGKMLGGWLIVVICFEAMCLIALLFALPYIGTPLDNIPNILHAMLLMPVKYAILIAMITYLSLWLPEAAAGFIGLAMFVAGHFSEKILDLATDEFAAMPLMSQGFKASYALIPHLTWVFSPSILDPNWTDFTTPGPALEWLFWAIIYFAIVAALAVFSFRKRSL